MYFYLLLLALVPLLSCDAPGPLEADRDPGELFGPGEENLIVVDAVLFVDARLPPVVLRRTAAPGIPYAAAQMALSGASVSIRTDDAVFEFGPDPDVVGRYLPLDPAAAVEPGRTYELRVDTGDDPVVRATTRTPPRMRIAELVLLDMDRLVNEGLEVELRRLRLFSEAGDQVYEAEENQLEYAEGPLLVRLQQDEAAVSYQFATSNLEHFSPLLFANDWIDVEDLERGESSPLLAAGDDKLYLPWDGIYHAGRFRVKLFAVDRNWFDLVRTDNVDAGRVSGEAGQSFQRPVFHIENGIGLFASAAVDSVGFFVRPRGSPACSGCACWGCEDRPTDWSGMLDPNTGRGQVKYRKTRKGGTCELSYEITEAVAIGSCDVCSFAWEFDLGELTVISEEGDCGAADEEEGETVRFGQANEVISPEGGTPRFGLYLYDQSSGSGWVNVEDGWSLTPSDGEYEGLWLFGFDED